MNRALGWLLDILASAMFGVGAGILLLAVVRWLS